MHDCNAMQILKKKIQKKNGHKGCWGETQGPSQKDSIRLSLLHPKLLRYNSDIGVIIHIRMMCNSKNGINV